MKFLSKPLIGIIGCVLLLMLSACGTAPGGQNTSAANSGFSNGNTSSGSTDANSDADPTFGVKVARVSVKGQTEAVLVNAQGFTLYTFKPDTATTTACTKACAVTWPPLLAKDGWQSTYDKNGPLTAVQDANGTQVQANGHFLYTFSKDKEPGQANGQGVGGKWFVVSIASTLFGVKVAQVNVKGQIEDVLVNAQGFTLYTFKPDTATTTACTKACAVTWPPQLTKKWETTYGNGDGPLTAVQNANGTQVRENDHFLYTFSKDKEPGQANGQGVGGKWFVATAADALFGVKVAQVNVKGQTMTVLTNTEGFTLYTFTPDSPTTTACTKACAVTWPPQTTKQELQASFDHIGALDAIKDANGIQVQANHHFLYIFSKDKEPGQANGQGVGGKWFVAAPQNG